MYKKSIERKLSCGKNEAIENPFDGLNITLDIVGGKTWEHVNQNSKRNK